MEGTRLSLSIRLYHPSMLSAEIEDGIGRIAEVALDIGKLIKLERLKHSKKNTQRPMWRLSSIMARRST